MSLQNQIQKLLVKGRLSEVADDNIISLKGGEKENRYSVDLTDIDAKNISVINLGKNPHSSLINAHGGYKRICDYLILVPQENNRVVALLCELKKTYQGKGGEQLNASIPFLDYIKSLLHTHFDGNRQFKHQFIILACKMASRFDKQTVRPNPIQKQTIKFKRIRITLILGETIPFKRILT